MKIAITGAHRVGKTTLAEKLQESLPDYHYRPEPYYDLVETGYVFSDPPTVDDYIKQLEYSLDQISKGENNIIFDRCPIDFLAYIQAVHDSENIQSLYHRVQSVITEIDLLVYVPIEEPDLLSCPESELPELRSQVNEILNELIWEFGVETIEVNGALSARRDQVLTKISQIQ